MKEPFLQSHQLPWASWFHSLLGRKFQQQHQHEVEGPRGRKQLWGPSLRKRAKIILISQNFPKHMSMWALLGGSPWGVGRGPRISCSWECWWPSVPRQIPGSPLALGPWVFFLPQVSELTPSFFLQDLVSDTKISSPVYSGPQFTPLLSEGLGCYL